MKEENNIWDKLNFSNRGQKSAFDLLSEQSKYLVNATKGELKMEITAADGYIGEEQPKLAAIYTMYVVAPKLGNFRRKILTVAEYTAEGRFPVDVVVNIDGSAKIPGVTEEEFLKKVKGILSNPIIVASIENLFILSKQARPMAMQHVFTQKDNSFSFKGGGAFEGDFISSNKSLNSAHRGNTILFYFINDERSVVEQKFSNRNEYATEFEVYETHPFELRFEGILPDERIVMNYNIVEPPVFFD